MSKEKAYPLDPGGHQSLLTKSEAVCLSPWALQSSTTLNLWSSPHRNSLVNDLYWVTNCFSFAHASHFCGSRIAINRCSVWWRLISISEITSICQGILFPTTKVLDRLSAGEDYVGLHRQIRSRLKDRQSRIAHSTLDYCLFVLVHSFIGGRCLFL